MGLSEIDLLALLGFGERICKNRIDRGPGERVNIQTSDAEDGSMCSAWWAEGAWTRQCSPLAGVYLHNQQDARY